MNNELQKMLKNMEGKTFQYASQIHFVINCKIDEENDKCTIKTNLSTFDRRLENLKAFIGYWKPVTNVASIEQEAENVNHVTIFFEQESDLSMKLIQTLEDNIQKVKEDKNYIPQAQTINNSVNAMLGVAKMRLSVLKMMNKGVGKAK